MSEYASLLAHHSMVFDTVRNKAYVKAIKQAVHADSVVIDLGAGMGIHGLTAAKIGAKKVYLVEPAPVIELARQIAEANKLPNIETRQVPVEQLTLPDKVDVIISVFTGNFLLTEDLLPSLFLARDKFLAPGGQLIPDRAQMMVVPISALEYHQKYIGAWSEELDEINHSLVRQYAANSIYYDSAENFNAIFLASAGKLLDLDFMTADKASCHSKIAVTIEKDSLCHGWLGWFNIHIGEDWLSTSPEADKTHWSQAFLPIDPPIKLHAGDRVFFELKRAEYGEWAWTMEAGKHKQRHSTFLSEPLTPDTLLKKSDQYAPILGIKGQVAQQLLTTMDGKTPVKNLAEQILQNWPGVFTELKDALRFVRMITTKLD